MTDNLGLQNNSANQPLGGSGGGNDSLTPRPAKSPLEEAGVEPNPVSSTNLQSAVSSDQPATASPQESVVASQDGSMPPNTNDSLVVNPTTSTGENISVPSPVTPGLGNSPIPAGAPDPEKMPVVNDSQTIPTQSVQQPSIGAQGIPMAGETSQMPLAPESSTTPEMPAVPSPSASDMSGADVSGEPSEAPDTDEFLKSILDNKAANSEVDESTEPTKTTLNDMVGSEETQKPLESGADQSLATNTPSAAIPADTDMPTTTAPFVAPSPAETAPALTELDANPALAPTPAETPVDTTKPETAIDSGMSQIQSPDTIQPTDNPSFNQPADSDSLNSSTSPVADSPDQSVASDIFSKKPAQSKSPVKLILLVVLVAVVLGGIYFGAKIYFFPSSSSVVESGLETATSTNSSVALTGDTARKADLKSIQQALLNLYSANGKYPVATDFIKLNLAGNAVEKELVPNYLTKLPTDADSTRAYQYKSDGTTFTLTAVLDNESDPGVSIENGVALYKIDQSIDVATSATSVTTQVSSTTTTSGSSDMSAATLDTSSTSTDTSSDLF